MIRKVLVVSRATPHHGTGGMEAVTWDLARAWAAHGVSVDVLTTSIPGRSGAFTQEQVRVIPLAGTASGRYSKAWWRQSAAHWNEMRESPSVIFSVSAAARSIVRLRRLRPNTPIIMQAHGTSEMEIRSKLRAGELKAYLAATKNLMWWPVDLSLYRSVSGVVAIGESVDSSLSRWPQQWAAPAEKRTLIANGVDTQEMKFDSEGRCSIRSRLGFPEGSMVVCAVGRLHRQKRLDRLLRSVAVARSASSGTDVRLLLVGDGEHRAELQNLACALGIEDATAFVGRITRSELAAYYSAADVNVLTTGRIEGLPMSALESLACGLPCVIPDTVRGVPGSGECVVQVDASDIGAVARAIVSVGSGPRTSGSLLPPEHHLEVVAMRYLDLFDRVSRDPAVSGGLT